MITPVIVTSCLGCETPASLWATLAVIALGALIAWRAERRASTRIRSQLFP